MSAMIRNIILDKYNSLSIGYITQSHTQILHDIDITRLKPPPAPNKGTKEYISMSGCIIDLKNIFNEFNTKGMSILENMEKSGMKIKARFRVKTDKELKQALRDKDIRIFLKKISYAFKLMLS